MKILSTLALLMMTPLMAYSFDHEKLHINSRVELNLEPGTLLEIGESVTTKTALYFGFLAPNNERSMFDIEIDMTYIFSRADYFFNGSFEKGFYIGSLLSYAEIKYSEDEVTDKVSGLGLGVQTGYIWNLKKFTIGSSIKAQHYFYDRFQSFEAERSSASFHLPHHEWLVGTIDLGYKF